MISVIIPHYELHDMLFRACLDPLYVAGGSDEVIIVDNGSKDALNADTPFKTIRSDSRLSFAGACNLGAKNATGDILVFLNNDCQVIPGWEDGILKAFKDKNTAIVGAKILDMQGRIQHVGVEFGKKRVPYHEHLGEEPDKYKGIKDAIAVTGAFMAIRKDWFDSVGGFHDYPGGNYEDVDLCLKAKDTGREVKISLDSTAYHLGGASYGLHPEEHTELLIRRNWEILNARWKDKPDSFFNIKKSTPLLQREEAWGL